MLGGRRLTEIGNVNGRRREAGQQNKQILSKSRKSLVINIIFFGDFFDGARVPIPCGRNTENSEGINKGAF